MDAFLFFAAISWLIVATLFVAEGRTRVSSRGETYRHYRVAGTTIAFKPAAARILALGLAGFGLLLIAVVTVGQVATTGYLYSAYDFFTSRLFGKIVLGCIFGSLLASWMMRIYRGSVTAHAARGSGAKDVPEQAFSLTQKIEGIALLLLFVVGSTSVSLDEMLRGLAYDKDGVRFNLASATTANASPTPNSALLLEQSSAQGTAARSGEDKLALLTNLAQFIERDADYISADANAELAQIVDRTTEKQRFDDLMVQLGVTPQLKAAAQFYKARFAALAACLSELDSVTGDSVYLQQQMHASRVALRELFMVSLAEHGRAPDQMIPAASNLNDKLSELAKAVVEHADAIRGGVLAVRVPSSPTTSADDPTPLASCRQLPTAYADAAAVRNEAVAAGGYADRPYLAVAYSAMLQFEQQPLAGVDALSDWLEVQERSVKARKSVRENAIVRRWYEVRILSTQYLLFQDLFERQPDQPEVMRDRFISVMDRLKERIGESSLVRSRNNHVFEPRMALIQADFTRDVDLVAGCESDSLQVQANFSLLTVKLNRVQAMIGHSALMERFAPEARAEIADVVEANMACVEQHFSKPRTNFFRAEALMTYARLTTAEAKARRPINADYRADTFRDLRTASNALLLARALIEGVGTSAGSDRADVRASQLAGKGRDRALQDRINAMLADNRRWSDRLAVN